MRRATIASAAALTLVMSVAPRADRAPHVAAVALTTGQRHHYTIGARVRPLLFWIGKDDVGDAVLAVQRGADASAYALLIGSDPQKAPRSINRWGYIAEETRGQEAMLVGLMTESDEDSVAQAEENLRKAGDRKFNVIRAATSGGETRSVVTSVAAPSNCTFHQVDTILDLAERNGVDGSARVVRLPSGARSGFLTPLADLLHTQAAGWRATGKVGSTEPITYVYHGRVYQMRATRAHAVASARIGTKLYERLIESQFQIKNMTGGDPTNFSITYAADGPLAEIPIAATYQPRWWIDIQLTLDDSRPGPLPPVETTR